MSEYKVSDALLRHFDWISSLNCYIMDDGEHTADEQQHRQKGKRGKRASPLLFIVFHIHSPIQNKDSLFQAVPQLFAFLLFHFLLADADGVCTMT